MEKIEVSEQFKEVLRFVNETNELIFLTGKAGTGKTTLLRYIREKTFKQMAVVAPTGVAAINAGGATIHSFFQLPFTPFIPPDEPSAFKSQNRYSSERLGIFRNLELLVIDEVSMVRADLLDQVDHVLRYTRRKWSQPFGGVQVLLIGDMYQLPPVTQSEEWTFLSKHYVSPYFFDSKVIQKNRPVYFELEKIYRQNEKEFIDLLNKVRNNEMDQRSLEMLNSHFKANISQQDFRQNITLTTHNRKADAINSNALQELKGKPYSFKSKVQDIFPEKNYPADEVLILKEGTRVMFLKNNIEKDYYNGKTGVVSKVDDKTLKVRCDEDGKEIEVKPEIWHNISYEADAESKAVNEQILGTFTQIPLRLAWAITIHKSQGLTFNRVIIDAAEAFSAGQVYVALSRCRSLSGLTLNSKISAATLFTDKRVSGFSSTKQADSEMGRIFASGHKNYIRSLLHDLFDFSPINEARKDMAGYLQLYNNRLNAEGLEWSRGFFDKLDALHEVSKKFQNQLAALLDVSDTAKLNERLNKAAVYFETECDALVKLLKNCTLRTESKEAAEDLNALIWDFYEDLFFKKKMMLCCQNGFSLQHFVQQRLETKIPFVELNIYSNVKNTKITGEIKNPALFKKLLLLRDEICNDDHKPINSVAANKTLQELSAYLPTDSDQLMKISGFGEAKVEEFGDRFIKVIKDYMLEHSLESKMNELPGKSKKKKKEKEPAKKVVKGESSLTSYQLFKEGWKPEEIAKERGYTLGTIEGHLAQYVGNGKIGLGELMEEKKAELILKALKNFDESKGMNEIKKSLPEDVSFSEIRYVLAHKKRQSSE